MLQYFLFILFASFAFTISNHASESTSFSEISQKIKNHLIDNNPYILSKVDTDDKTKTQMLNLKMMGLHQKTCRQTFRHLSKYENYSEYLDFVSQSRYYEKNNNIFLVLSSALLPFEMILDFELPRITGPGKYNFRFKHGFLKGLIGVILVEPFKYRSQKFQCFVSLRANWSGKETKIPDTIFELFTATISRIAIEKLFRISGHKF